MAGWSKKKSSGASMFPLMSGEQSFHQRNPLPAGEAERGEEAARPQEATILEYFQDHPEAVLTPPEVQQATGLQCLMTSIRRSLTNLTNQGHLEKREDNQRPGLHGVSNCTWCLRRRTS